MGETHVCQACQCSAQYYRLHASGIAKNKGKGKVLVRERNPCVKHWSEMCFRSVQKSTVGWPVTTACKGETNVSSIGAHWLLALCTTTTPPHSNSNNKMQCSVLISCKMQCYHDTMLQCIHVTMSQCSVLSYVQDAIMWGLTRRSRFSAGRSLKYEHGWKMYFDIDYFKTNFYNH